MKVIIAGTRSITTQSIVDAAVVESGFIPTEIVSGGCRGADRLGEDWAKRNRVPIKPFEAEWKIYGYAAGPIRNKRMADYADALIAIWNGQSSGTKSMISLAREKGIPVFIHLVQS